MRRFVRAHKTHLDPSRPSARHPPPLILSRARTLYPSFYSFLSLSLCSVSDPSMEVNKDGQIMERPHEGITRVKRVGWFDQISVGTRFKVDTVFNRTATNAEL